MSQVSVRTAPDQIGRPRPHRAASPKGPSQAHRTSVRSMARTRSHFDDPPTLKAAKAMIKSRPEEDRSHLLKWLAHCFRNDGRMFSPQIRKARQRIVLDGNEYWLVALPKQADP